MTIGGKKSAYMPITRPLPSGRTVASAYSLARANSSRSRVHWRMASGSASVGTAAHHGPISVPP